MTKYTNDEIYDLVKRLSELDINELTVKSEDLTIKIKHGGSYVEQPVQQIKAAHSSAANQPIQLKDEADEEELPGKTISAPINGTFYSAAGPEDPDYVKVGDRVKKGAPICILEAMKMMNTINMPEDGVILSVEAQNEDIVDCGQVLVRYEAV